MERHYDWRLEIKVTCGDNQVNFEDLPAWAKNGIMHMVRNGSSCGDVIFDDGLKDNCQNGSYNCDNCGRNGDCLDQGLDGEPRWKEGS